MTFQRTEPTYRNGKRWNRHDRRRWKRIEDLYLEATYRSFIKMMDDATIDAITKANYGSCFFGKKETYGRPQE